VFEGRYNIALGQALIDSHSEGTSTDTLRFLRFPPTALVGRHQDISREVNVKYCIDNNVGLARRITGGGAIFLDEGQLGWELVVHRKTLGKLNLSEVAEKVCTAAANGLSKLGIDVKYRPRNDLEVDGRKISGTGGFFDGDTLFFQGTVLVDMNPEDMERALNVPQAKLRKKGIATAGQRIVTLKELLGEKTPAMPEIEDAVLSGIVDGFNFEPIVGDFTAAENQKAKEFFDEEIGREDFLYEIDSPTSQHNVLSGTHQSAGGAITSYIRLDGTKNDRIREVVITGDFFITPPRVILDLESKLRGQWLKDVEASTLDFFAQTKVDMMSAQPQDFILSLQEALKEGAAE
jgi:lipoate-protein ligase A